MFLNSQKIELWWCSLHSNEWGQGHPSLVQFCLIAAELFSVGNVLLWITQNIYCWGSRFKRPPPPRRFHVLFESWVIDLSPFHNPCLSFPSDSEKKAKKHDNGRKVRVKKGKKKEGKRKPRMKRKKRRWFSTNFYSIFWTYLKRVSHISEQNAQRFSPWQFLSLFAIRKKTGTEGTRSKRLFQLSLLIPGSVILGFVMGIITKPAHPLSKPRVSLQCRPKKFGRKRLGFCLIPRGALKFQLVFFRVFRLFSASPGFYKNLSGEVHLIWFAG